MSKLTIAMATIITLLIVIVVAKCIVQNGFPVMITVIIFSFISYIFMSTHK